MHTFIFWSVFLLACGVLLPRYYTAGRSTHRAIELRMTTLAIDILVLLSLTLPWIPESRSGPMTGLALLAGGDGLMMTATICVSAVLLLFVFARASLLLKIGSVAHLLAIPLFFAALLRALPGTFEMTLADAAPVAAIFLLLCGSVSVLLLWHRLQVEKVSQWPTRSMGIAAAVVVLVFAYTASVFLLTPTVLDSADAVQAVRQLPKVAEYVRNVPSAIVDVDDEDANGYSIHVYEVKNGHTATFGWYTVDRRTGEIEDVMGGL